MTSKLISSNPEEVMVIRKVQSDIITLNVPFYRFGHVRIGGRCTIVRLQNGPLAVFSPVALTQGARDAVNSLGGNVKYIIAPDMEHHIFLTPWKEAYPDAQIIAPEGLQEKREKKPETKGIVFDHIFTAVNKGDFKVSDEFHADFDVEYVNSHPGRDIVLLHKSSKTLIEADLIFNLPATEQFSKSGESATKGILTKIISTLQSTKPPAKGQKRLIWYLLSARDRKGFAQSVATIDGWNFDRIIPCHGDIIENGGKEIFRNLFEWNLEAAKK
ncbi:hypothetical protein I7I53_00670 [Histoplasma capsulatum var. duboisii H88]|uniref:DUF4336 domain-containing protein n=2 Tax=Ajellomyces capsulatus TaxID=5037 RepID=A0A8A1LKA1_AJEC8|nr:conserved hypothetical protein [Histoplasma capsulatum H143]QSS53415.1 hypothetical protein I7I53_00670 [Histoplasma capsulatum var. duboisii H88]